MEAVTSGGWVGVARGVNGVSTNPARGNNDWLTIGTRYRPDRTLPSSKKDLVYDGACGAYYIGLVNATTINTFRREYYWNVAYTLGQWGEQEDVKVFLKDKGRSTSRVKFTLPLLQPTLTRLRGAADNLSISAMAVPATQFAQTRKERRLMERLAMSVAAQASEVVARAFAQQGISPDEQVTEQIHENTYQDELIPAITSLMKMIGLQNNLDTLKRDIAKHIALSGIAAIHSYSVGGKLVNELCEPDEVGWDPACNKSDFTDGEFWFHCPVMSVQQIAERFQAKKAVIEELDKWANLNTSGDGNNAWPQRLPRVFTVYFRDIEHYEGGFVKDEDGDLIYVVINEPDAASKDGTPKYTDADLQDPPETELTAEWTDEEWAAKKQKRWREVMRYSSLIPWEYLPGVVTNNMAFGERIKEDSASRLKDWLNNQGDLILAGGKCDLQEVHPDDTYGKGSPIKFTSWTYIAGNPVAPLTAARSPQRVMNQLTTDLMFRLRKAGGVSPVIDTDAMNGSTMTEAALFMAMKEGDPINIKGAIVGGLNNAVSRIDNSPGPGFYNMFAMIPEIKGMMEGSVGVFDQNFGAPGPANQLVGTMQLQLQQQGVQQQPFNASVARLYEQQHQFNAQVGKQFYGARPWALKQMVGDKGAQAILLSKDMQYEQFRIEIVLTPNAQEIRTIVDNQIIPMRMQMGLLGPQEAAELFGRAFPADVDAACRKFTAKMALAQQAQAEAQQMQMQADALAAEEQMVAEEEEKVAKREQDAALKAAQIQQKLQQPYAVNDAKNLDPSLAVETASVMGA
jgi:hypothetical protein